LQLEQEQERSIAMAADSNPNQTLIQPLNEHLLALEADSNSFLMPDFSPYDLNLHQDPMLSSDFGIQDSSIADSSNGSAFETMLLDSQNDNQICNNGWTMESWNVSEFFNSPNIDSFSLVDMGIDGHLTQQSTGAGELDQSWFMADSGLFDDLMSPAAVIHTADLPNEMVSSQPTTLGTEILSSGPAAEPDIYENLKPQTPTRLILPDRSRLSKQRLESHPGPLIRNSWDTMITRQRNHLHSSYHLTTSGSSRYPEESQKRQDNSPRDAIMYRQRKHSRLQNV
jgi:hypothetical protein